MLHIIQSQQLLRCSRKEAWAYISDPGNLAEITPAYMDFKVLSGAGRAMYAGQIIEYSVKPLLGIPLHWVTEITHVREGHYFVDEQRFGPYTFWHHQHELIDAPDGVLMNDTVHYKLPLGILGRIANQLAIKRQLGGIFAYRSTKFEKLFNQKQ